MEVNNEIQASGKYSIEKNIKLIMEQEIKKNKIAIPVEKFIPFKIGIV